MGGQTASHVGGSLFEGLHAPARNINFCSIAGKSFCDHQAAVVVVSDEAARRAQSLTSRYPLQLRGQQDLIDHRDGLRIDDETG